MESSTPSAKETLVSRTVDFLVGSFTDDACRLSATTKSSHQFILQSKSRSSSSHASKTRSEYALIPCCDKISCCDNPYLSREDKDGRRSTRSQRLIFAIGKVENPSTWTSFAAYNLPVTSLGVKHIAEDWFDGSSNERHQTRVDFNSCTLKRRARGQRKTCRGQRSGRSGYGNAARLRRRIFSI